jgi:hypothetical protein
MKKCHIKTIDARHNRFIKELKNEYNNKNDLEHDLKDLSAELHRYTNIKKTKMTDDDFDNFLDIQNKVQNNKSKIESIDNQRNLINYYLNNASILTTYYTSKKKIANNEEINKNNVKNSECFNKKTIIENVSLLDKYLLNNEHNYVKKLNQINLNICQKCNVEMTIYNIECIMECPTCGKINYIIIDSSKPNYKEPPPEVSYFAYKRINHFNEWLCQFQGKETTDIPEEVYNKIIIEIKKERITNMTLISPHKIRHYLKKLKLNKYYEHTTHIINRLNGVSSPIIDKETENKLRRMFKDIQEPFMKVCPKDRKNFLSYSYVLHKFVELLQMNELKQYFPLLKSREKLHLQDLIWRDICELLEWPFYKSI